MPAGAIEIAQGWDTLAQFVTKIHIE